MRRLGRRYVPDTCPLGLAVQRARLLRRGLDPARQSRAALDVAPGVSLAGPRLHRATCEPGDENGRGCGWNEVDLGEHQARAVTRGGELLQAFQSPGGRPSKTRDAGGTGFSQREAARSAGMSKRQE